jgi:hypothetical protein
MYEWSSLQKEPFFSKSLLSLAQEVTIMEQSGGAVGIAK